MPWHFSIPEPYDAQIRARHGLAASETSHTIETGAITPRSYADLADENPNGSNTTSYRALRQFSLFAFGAACVVTSAVLTRRATIRKYLTMRPAGMFTPSNYVPPVSGAFDAAEALGLATLNVTSVSAMLIGGGFWAFDVSGMEDLRLKVGRTMELMSSEEPEEQLDQEIEDFLPVLMARMTGKSEAEISLLIKEAQEQGKVKKSASA